uniref:Uncharacterized protein n=1 Tax=Photinus pyralis TaxID=7054 RepID=A0A1Y1M3G1_PHOPY
MRVKPIHADTTVCPTPQKRAYKGSIGYVADLYTKAITALLTIPEVIGGKTPINKINIGKNFPNLCFLKVKNAINAAIVCTKIEENKAHRKTWYHIFVKLLRASCWSQNTVLKESISELLDIVNCDSDRNEPVSS